MVNEKRLIDANVLTEQMAANFEQCVYEGVDSEECQIALDTIAEAPTVDAVEVVRCKDCRCLEITGCYGECKRGYMGIVKPWDFCSYGERKGNEKENRP